MKTREREIRFKSCPRCNGDLVLKSDNYGRYADCLQCGHHMELGTTSRSSQLSEQARIKSLNEAYAAMQADPSTYRSEQASTPQ